MAGKILVLGATGNVGRPLVKALMGRGEAVKAASRGGKPVDGAEGVEFDIGDPMTFPGAFEGVDRAFVMLPGGYTEAKALLLPIIEAAATRGVKVVLLSVLGADADDSIPYRQAEIALEKSGVKWVVLRPNWFTDNFINYWKPGIDAAGVIAVPAADGKTSFIDARDIADSAAAALTTDRFDDKAFNLTGPEALDYSEAAALISEVIGQPVAYQAIDDETFIGNLVGAGVPEVYARFLASIFYPVREGWTAVVTDDVRTLTGHPARQVAAWVKENADKLKS
jgi:uncharacterized protein YbjT (DUF2867 family)